MTPLVKIAAGHDNVAGLTPLHLISPPLFGDWRTGLRTRFKRAETREMNGDRGYQLIGKPEVEWEFEWMYPQEYQLLRVICPAETAPVTITTLNKHVNEWQDFNATMQILAPDDEDWEMDLLERIKVRFYDLERIV